MLRKSIAVDIDSVICNLEEHMAQYVRENYDSSFTVDKFYIFNIEDNKYLSDDCKNGLIRLLYSPDFIYGNEIYPGADEAMNELYKIFDIFLVTSRNKYYLGKETRKWLAKYNIPYNDLYFTKDFKDWSTSLYRNTKIYKFPWLDMLNVDFYIEDYPDEILMASKFFMDSSNPNRKIYCVNRPWNINYEFSDNVVRVDSLKEASILIIGGLY
jgi:5'(3')-deoxyribonucleotidase